MATARRQGEIRALFLSLKVSPATALRSERAGTCPSDFSAVEGDRHDSLKKLAEACQNIGWQVHANCLMPDHYHLVVETPTLPGGRNGLAAANARVPEAISTVEQLLPNQ